MSKPPKKPKAETTKEAAKDPAKEQLKQKAAADVVRFQSLLPQKRSAESAVDRARKAIEALRKTPSDAAARTEYVRALAALNANERHELFRKASK